VADELSKMASGRELVSTDVFASDQHKLSFHCEEPKQASNEPPTSGSGTGASNKPLAPGSGADLSMAPSKFKVMEINEDPKVEPEENPSAGSDPLLDWRALYLNCLVREILPADKVEARRLARHAKSYVIIKGELYKKSHTKVLQRCIPTKQGRKLLEDIHRSACGHHAMPRILIGNAFRQGFNWPTVVANATHIVHTGFNWPTVVANATHIVHTYEGCQ
jgi:hypothetical protein